MMVCRYDDRRLVLILQIDHSRVAGLIAAHWGNEEFARPRPYASMVIAAQEHDSGWWDWEIKPTLTEQGRPIDYIGSAARLGEVWLAAGDPHHIYGDRAAEVLEWDAQRAMRLDGPTVDEVEAMARARTA